MLQYTRISGGQKQRIAVARALIKKAPLLILDEATSAVDNQTEKEILDSLTEEKKEQVGSQIIINVAHRLNTTEQSDRVIFLDDGRLVAEGAFEELSKNNMEFSRKVVGIDNK